MSLSTSSFISLITECLPLPDFSPSYSHPSLAYLAFFSWMVDIVCVTKQSVWIEFSSFKDCFSWQLVYLRLSVWYLQGLSLNFAWPPKSSLIPGLLQTLHWPLLLLGLHWMSPIFLLWLDRWKCLPALCVFWVLLRLQFSGHSSWSFMGIRSPHVQTQWRLHTGCRSSFPAQCLPFQNTFLASAFLNYNLCFLQLSKAILTCSPLLCTTVQNEFVFFLQGLTVLHCLLCDIWQHLVYICFKVF